MKFFKRPIICVAAIVCTVGLSAQTNVPKLNANNIDEVIKAMTLEEKASILVGGGNAGFAGSGAMMGAQKKLVAGAAGITVAIPRLGIPSTVLTDGPAGVHIDATREGTSQTFYATGFPIGTALACTWNTDLVKSVGKAMGNEVLEYGCDVILGPGMNLHRNPLCGRNFEYYSEDPVVTGKIGAAMVQGIQSMGVGTSAKHFAVNSQETDRTKVDERVSQRALRELYLKGFEIMVKESQPWTIMASYNKINGTLAQQSHDLLTTILRDEWGFKGMVMTDWIGKRNTTEQVHAGNDLMMPGYPSQAEEIIQSVKDGKLDINDVNTDVKRVLEMIVKSPRFKGYQYTNKPDLKAHAAITRQSSTEGMVLLKNDKVLPMQNLKTVALFGVNSYDFLSGGLGSGCVHTPYVVDMVTGLKNAGISTTKTLTDIYQKYVEYEKVKFQADKDPVMWFLSQGQPKLPEMEVTRRCIDAEIGNADAAIFTIGRQAGEGLDRDINVDFNISDAERKILSDVSDAFHQQGKPVIVIINSGSVIETASWRNLADAILVAWQPGEEGGNSVADVLTGKANPSGKLTMTWPVAATDNPSTKNFPQEYDMYTYQILRDANQVKGENFSNHEEDIYVGYRYFDTFNSHVASTFGYGLYYNTFAFSHPSAKLKRYKIEVSCTVKNTGNVSGKQVAEVYVTAPKGKIQKPVHELKAFAKTKELKPGESETLKMAIDKMDLASFDDTQSQWTVDTGIYTFGIGSSSRDIYVKTSLTLSGISQKVNDVMKPQVELNFLKQ